MIEVVEHLRKPWEELSEIHQSLEKGGELLLTTPNLKGLNAQLMRSKWREINQPTHVILFEKKTLKNLLMKVGFKNIRFIRFYPVAGDSRLKRVKIFLNQLFGFHGGICVIATK